MCVCISGDLISFWVYTHVVIVIIVVVLVMEVEEKRATKVNDLRDDDEKEEEKLHYARRKIPTFCFFNSPSSACFFLRSRVPNANII